MFDLVKVVNTYVSKKDNKEHSGYNFYLVDKDGNRIAVKPSFSNDYRLLTYLANEVKK